MSNGQLAPLLATHGATIPVPFLIGTDSWALFVHRPWGEFDLREGNGRFMPGKEALDKQPLEFFVISAPEPVDALKEYIHLTGHPVMPPKWALGYFQSHRTLAGPEEPLSIARTFREKKLPCDALIYLGTGYCTNRWNMGHLSLDFNAPEIEHPGQHIKTLQLLHFIDLLHTKHAPRD